jgi:hypothetical protein
MPSLDHKVAPCSEAMLLRSVLGPCHSPATVGIGLLRQSVPWSRTEAAEPTRVIDEQRDAA